MHIPDNTKRAICADCAKKLQQKDRICCIDPYSKKDSEKVKRINLCESCFDKRTAIQLSFDNGDINLKEFKEIKSPPNVTEKSGRRADKDRRKADRRRQNLQRKVTLTQEIADMVDDDAHLASVH